MKKKNSELSDVKPVGKEKITKPSETIDELLFEQKAYLSELNESISSGLIATGMLMNKEIDIDFYIVKITDIISNACSRIKNILWLNKIAFTKSSYTGVPKDSAFIGKQDKNILFIREIDDMINYHSRFAEKIKEASIGAESDNNSLAMHIDALVYLVDDLLAWEEVVLANMVYGSSATKYMCQYYNMKADAVLSKLKEYKNLLEDNLS